MSSPAKTKSPFVSRAGLKLDHALNHFALNVTSLTCADFGCNAGGFTDCLLQRGAAKVYAVDTGYGALEYKLRRDPRVITMERTNALHATFHEPFDLIVIDLAWTRQRHALPAARKWLKPTGCVVTLIKPHYEVPKESADTMLVKGILQPEHLPAVLASVRTNITAAGFTILGETTSPIEGHGGNAELLFLLAPAAA